TCGDDRQSDYNTRSHLELGRRVGSAGSIRTALASWSGRRRAHSPGARDRHRYAQRLLHGSRWHWRPCIPGNGISVKMYVFISASVLALWNLRKCWRYTIGLCCAFRGLKLRQLQSRWQQAWRIPADPASIRQCQVCVTPARPRPASIMKQDHVDLEAAYRDQWFALLDKNGVPRPVALQVIAVP